MASSPEIDVEWISEFSSYSSTKCHTVKAVCSLKAPKFEPVSDGRGRIDLVAVIDISGSMSDKLELVKNALKVIIDELQDDDRFSVVTFDTVVEVVFGLTPMTSENREEKKKVISGLYTKGSTNLCEGLLTGMYEVIDRPASNEDGKADVASLFLFTDGQANVELIQEEDILMEMKKAINPPKEYMPFKATVNTFGFGSSNDPSLLTAISVEGGGIHHWISSKSQIKPTLQGCFGGIISTLSKDTTLSFTANHNARIVSVHTPRSPVWEEKNVKCSIEIDDLQSEEKKDFLVEIEIPEIPTGSQPTNPVVSCELKYTNVISNSVSTKTSCLELVRNSDIRNQTANIKVDEHSNRLLATQAMREARQIADTEMFDEAKKKLQDAKTKIVCSVSKEAPLSQDLVKDIDKAISQMNSKDLYKASGAHYLISTEQSHAKQRMSNFGIEGNKTYRTTSKEVYAFK